MTDFIHWLPATFTLEEQAGDGHDDARHQAGVTIGMDDSPRDVDSSRRTCAGIDEPAFCRFGGTGAVIPQINTKIRRAGKNEIIVLKYMLMWPARYSGNGPGATGHQRLKIFRNFVRTIQFVKAAPRVGENRQGLYP